MANKAYVDNAVSAGSSANTGLSMLSALSGSTMTHANAVAYCRNLSAAPQFLYEGGSDTTVYTDWRLPTVEEGALFEAITSDTTYIWTATVSDANDNAWILLRLSDGAWNYNGYNTTYSVRCVR